MPGRRWVTHPSTNRARRRATSMIKTNVLPLSRIATRMKWQRSTQLVLTIFPEVALQRAEKRMVRWMCGVKLQDRVPSKQLRWRLGLEDIISVLQQNRLRWYEHVLRKDNDWVKKCMEYEVEGTRPRGRPKKTWREIVEKDCKARGLNREDVMDCSRWRKQIGMIDDHDECE